LSHVVLLVVSLLSTVVLVSSSVLLLSHVVSSVVWLSTVLLHELEKLLDDLGQMWLTGEIVPLESTGLLLSVLLEIGLVLKLGHLDLSNFLDLVVVDDQDLSINLGVGKLLLGGSAGVWLFVANESVLVSSSVFLWFKSDVLKFSVFTEFLSDVLLSPAVWEVLDVKVDSLLGGFISDSLHEFLLFSLRFAQSVSNVKLKSFWSWGHFSVHEGIDGFVDASWSVGLVFVVWISKADETVLTDIMLEHDEGLNVSEWGEKFLNLILSHLSWDVLEIKVVDEFTEVLSVVFWFKSERVGITVGGFKSILLVFEANVSETFLGVIWVDGDFQGFDWSILGEVFGEEIVGDWLVGWGLVENVVVGQFVFVASEKLLIERKGSALVFLAWLISFNLEVSHLITGLLVLNWVLDDDDGGVEGSEEVSSDLWSLLDDSTALLSESFSNFDGANLIFWEIVKIHVISLSFELHIFCFCFF